MSVFRKRKITEISIASTTLALVLTLSILFLIFKVVPTIQEYNEFLMGAVERNELKGIESIEAQTFYSKRILLLVPGISISVSNIISFLLFRSFSRIIPKRIGTISFFVSLGLIVHYLLKMLISTFYFEVIIDGIIFAFLSLGVTFLLLYFATPSKKDYF